MKRQVAEIIGWYGAIAIILAYFLNSFLIIEPTSFIYQALNLSGAIGIIVISLVKKVYQSVVLNIFWGTIALFALAHIIIKVF